MLPTEPTSKPRPGSNSGPAGGPILEIRDLRKSYGTRAVLSGLDLRVEREECLVILGRSGSGKSVTLRLLIGLDPPDSGSIRYDGLELVASRSPASPSSRTPCPTRSGWAPGPGRPSSGSPRACPTL